MQGTTATRKETTPGVQLWDRWASTWYGVAVSVAVGLALMTAVTKGPADAGRVPVVIAATVVSGLLVSALSALRLRSLLIGTVIGLFTGLFSAMQFLTQPLIDPFVPAGATLGFFTLIGFVIGGLVEFATFIHHLAHGGTPSEYPTSKGDSPQKG